VAAAASWSSASSMPSFASATICPGLDKTSRRPQSWLSPANRAILQVVIAQKQQQHCSWHH
jgi:hypothetical protein